MRPNYEPAPLAFACFAMYLSSLGIFFLLGLIGGCGLKGYCSAPTSQFILTVLPHWIVCTLIIKRSVKTAAWLQFIFGFFPLVWFAWLTSIDELEIHYAVPVLSYLFAFGILFPAYLFCSKSVATYVKRNNNSYL